MKTHSPIAIAAISAVGLYLAALADVVCMWNGTAYDCSGSGDVVIVEGGGNNYTNQIGSCTNCSAIPPATLRELALAIDARADEIINDAAEIGMLGHNINSDIETNLAEIATYRTFILPISEPDGFYASQVTNYMYTVDNGQTAGMKKVLQEYDDWWEYYPVQKFEVIGGACNGIYHYANDSVKPQLQQKQRDVNTMIWYADQIGTQSAPDIKRMSGYLLAGAVECEGSGGSDTNGTNSVVSTGNWCTFEQGEAIKTLLQELSDYLGKCNQKLQAISNYASQAVHAIRTGLFTDYTAIPPASQLGDTWQQVYLDGHETNWGYAPTNILARIELLLYGMSGVGTNATEFTDQGPAGSTEVLDDIEDNQDVKRQLDAIDSDADDTQAKSLGQSLVSLFQALDLETQAHSSQDVAISSVSYRVGNYEGYVDSIGLPQDVGWLNSLRSTCGAIAGAAYMIAAAVMIFGYWRWFAGQAVKMSKWAVELITSLFAS